MNGASVDPETSALADFETSVLATIADERGPGAQLRAWPRVRRLAIVALALAAVVAFFWTFLLRPDHATYPGVRYFALGGGYALMALVAGWHALRPLWLPPAPRWLLHATFAAGMLLPIVAALLPELPTLARFAPSAHRHVTWSYSCWLLGGGAGLVVLLVARALDRGGHRGRDHALAAALAASMVGLLALHIECPLNFTVHLLVVHGALPLCFLASARWLWRARA